MSSSSVFHPGLTFATLVVQFAVARGSAIPSLDPRRKGGSEPGDPDEHSSSSSNGGSTSTKPTSSSAPVSHSSTPTSSSSGSSSSSSSGSSSSSNSPSPTALTLPPTPATRSDITTAGIVGVVIGSVAIIGLTIMLISKCIRRAKKTKMHTKGPNFFRLGSSSPVRPQSPVTEMSQTQSSPIITSAIAAGLTSHPVLSRYSQSTSTNTTASLSPLMPFSNLERTRSDAGASDESPSTTNGSGAHSDTTHDTLSYVSSLPSMVGNVSPSMGLLPIITAAAIANTPPPAAHIGESVLHRSLTLHQKSLEEDTKGRNVGRMDIDVEKGDNDPVNDPPPSYDA